MSTEQQKDGNGCFWLIVTLVAIGLIYQCNGNKSGSDSNFSITSLFSNKPYKLNWDRNLLIVEMPYPTMGGVGINKIDWGKVDVDDLVEDIYDELKDSRSQQCILSVRFTSKGKDVYGNDTSDKSSLYYIWSGSPAKVSKFQSGQYFNEYYHITERILASIGIRPY